jgi:ligand-binding sensor domain-containing protein
LYTPKISFAFDPLKIYTKNVSLPNGLSQCVVTDMVVDQKGFLWVGTFDGLNRFDGSNITIFKHIPGNTSTLPSSKIHKLFADDDGHLWVKTNNGLSILDTRTGKVIQPGFLQDFETTWVHRASDNKVWLYANKKGLLLVNTKNMRYTLYKNDSHHLPENCLALDIYKYKDMVYILGTCGDVICFNSITNEYSLVKNTKTKNIQYDNSGIGKFGNIYFGSQHSDMLFYNTTDNTFQATPFYDQSIKLISVKCIKYDATNDLLLLGTYGQGLFVYNYANRVLSQHMKNGNEIKLSSNYIQCVTSDKNGVIYCGYDGQGFDVLDPFIKKFVTISREDPNDLKNLRYVRKILEDDQNNLLIGTSGSGLVKYNRTTQSCSFYNATNILKNSDNFIIDMIRVGNELWIGFNGGGIDILDIHSFRHLGSIFPGESANGLTSGFIWSFLADQEGNVWVGTRENGLNKIHIATRKVTKYNKIKFPQFNTGIRCLAKLSTGNIIIGTENGLFEWNTNTEKIQKVFPLKKGEDGFNSFKSIYIDTKQRLWLTMDGSGIVVLSKEYTWLRNFNTQNALNNDVVYGLLPENDSVFWFSSNAGLSKLCWNENSLIENGKVEVFNYDEKNGLQSNEFNTGAFAQLRDGSMAFGGLNGINVFKPSDVKANPQLPKVYINEFKIFENDIQTDTSIAYRSHIALKHFENAFSITFNTIGFTLPGKTKYKYRLLGYDNDWIYADHRNYVSYTNMPPGNYSFQVKACNYDGVWNEEYTRLSIFIATPFYKAWWFYGLLLSSIIFILYAIYHSRIRIAEEKEALRLMHTKEIAEVEMKALRAQINPHFLFNSLNSINSYILKNDNKLASKYLVKFSQLVRNILNNSSSPYITLKEELNTIELYMHIEGMRFNNQFSYIVHVEEDINTANILIPSLLLQPYVENAIWHGLLHKEGDKNITIRVNKETRETVCIEIDDNGVGRKMAAFIEQKPKQRKSFGMQLGESRLKWMNNGQNANSSVQVIDKVDASQQGTGTIIKIIIPIYIFQEQHISLN